MQIRPISGAAGSSSLSPALAPSSFVVPPQSSAEATTSSSRLAGNRVGSSGAATNFSHGAFGRAVGLLLLGSFLVSGWVACAHDQQTGPRVPVRTAETQGDVGSVATGSQAVQEGLTAWDEAAVPGLGEEVFYSDSGRIRVLSTEHERGRNVSLVRADVLVQEESTLAVARTLEIRAERLSPGLSLAIRLFDPSEQTVWARGWSWSPHEQRVLAEGAGDRLEGVVRSASPGLGGALQEESYSYTTAADVQSLFLIYDMGSAEERSRAAAEFRAFLPDESPFLPRGEGFFLSEIMASAEFREWLRSDRQRQQQRQEHTGETPMLHGAYEEFERFCSFYTDCSLTWCFSTNSMGRACGLCGFGGWLCELMRTLLE